MCTKILGKTFPVKGIILDPYQAETNEQNSGENWSGGAEGGGFPTIACKSS